MIWQRDNLPIYHITALPEEKVALPYDPNGCIFWKGKYHLMYIYQDMTLSNGGHCWGHCSSTNLIDWTYHSPALVPDANCPEKGVFSGNAFVNKEGVPMLCWFGIDAGVCIAKADDDDLIHWTRYPGNPVIPIPKEGEKEYGRYTVWDPYLWFENGTYYCLLGGNTLPNKKDTLYLLESKDLASWQPLHFFYEQPDMSWTIDGEDCSCPDFFKLGDKYVLLCISHSVGARCYIGEYKHRRFFPEQHVRMNWPGAQFFAPETLCDGTGRRIVWGWVTDPRIRPVQDHAGSGFQSLPRVLSLANDGTLCITPAPELELLRKNERTFENLSLSTDSETFLDNVVGTSIELALEINPANAREVGLKVRCTPDGQEETAIWYESATGKLKVDVTYSTLRKDVVYGETVFTGYNCQNASENSKPVYIVEAPLLLADGEPLKLRVFLDGPMIEVFANDRQCVTQVVYPQKKDALKVKLCTKGGPASVQFIKVWDMKPAHYKNEKNNMQ